MKRYKSFLKAKLRSFILIIVDKLIWLLGLSERDFIKYPSNASKINTPGLPDGFFRIPKVIRINDIQMNKFDNLKYSEINKCNYLWDKLEASIRKNGILKPPHVTVNKYCNTGKKYKIRDGEHRCLIWSYLHEDKNPYIKVYVNIFCTEAKIVDFFNPWDYPNLVSILFTNTRYKNSRDKANKFKRTLKKRKNELKSKTYGPDTDR